MVNFFSSRIPQQSERYIVSEDTGNNRVLLEADPRRVRDSVAYWMDSNKTNRYTIAGDTMESVVAEKQGLYLASAVLTAGGGLLSSGEPEVYDNVLEAKTQQKGPGALLGLEASFPPNLKESGFGADNYNEKAIINGLMTWVKQNQERVTLGYGPNHPLDNIQPLATPTDYIPRDDRSVVDNFSEWLRELAEETAFSGNEHAFYVDENNNCIGVIGGGRSSVKYPASRPSQISLSAHTHPTVKSLAFPSDTDLRTNAFRCTEDSVDMIVLANHHTNFILDPSNMGEGRPEEATAVYPYDEVPVVLIEQDKEEDDSKIVDHHNSQGEKIKAMLDQQLQHKRRGVDSVESELSEPAFQYLESEFDKAVFLRDKLIEESKAIESLNDVGIEEGVKYTLSQEPLSL